MKDREGILKSAIVSSLLVLLLGACSAPVPDSFEETPPAYLDMQDGADLPGAPATHAEWARHFEGLDSLASYYEITEPPIVDVVAWIKPEERSLYVNPCIKEAGFQQEGRVWIGVTEDQRGAFQLANYKCSAAYPLIAKYTAPLTNQNKSNAYDWTIEHVIPCLESEGFTIRGIPSREVFISRFDSDPFFPFSQVGVLSNEEMEKLEADCVQWPPSEVLYGE